MVTLSEDGVTVQGPPAAPEYPALHVQAVRVILPAGELALAGQLLQIASPLVVLYDPAMHTVHVPSSVPENPAGHCRKHFVNDVVPDLEDFPDGHDKQVSSPSALNVPDSHVAQGPPAGPI